MKFVLLLFILSIELIYAYDIDTMLDIYRKESDLSKKTKNESMGSLTVYTRDDLERMQVHKLSELLNSLRSFRYDENMFGLPDVLHQDPAIYSSDVVKIFINNYEIMSSYAGSGLYLYGNIDMGFVDHVEIYEGSTSTYVNSEPSVVTIKLYTKVPEREAGANITAYGGSRGSHHENVSYADISDNLAYYIYASYTDEKRTQYEHLNHEIKRDYTEKHALMTLAYKDVSFDFEVLDHKSDPFLSMSMFATPLDGSVNYTLKRLSSLWNINGDKSLQLKASFIRVDANLNLNMDGGRWSSKPASLFLLSDHHKSSSVDDTFDIKLEKHFRYMANNLITGVEYIRKKMHGVEAYNNGIEDLDPDRVDTSIASAYIQDDFMFGRNKMLTASAKLNYYNNNSNYDSKSFNTIQARAGYIYTTKVDAAKLFVSYMKLPTEQYVLTSTTQNSIELLDIYDLTMEYNRQIQKHKIGLVGEYLKNENTKLLQQKGASKYFNNYSIGARYEVDFDIFNKFNALVYKNYYHSPVSLQKEQTRGATLRLLNSWKKFDIYNEANYYHVQKSDINGICYNLGVRYKVNNDLIITFKGTNIFDSAAKSEYKYVRIVGMKPVVNSLYISPIDQSFTVGMEYSF